PSYSGKIPRLAEDLRRARSAGHRVVCIARGPGSAKRLSEIFQEYELPAAIRVDADAPPLEPAEPGGLFVLVGSLRTGFELPDAGLTFLTEREIFGEDVKPAERK